MDTADKVLQLVMEYLAHYIRSGTRPTPIETPLKSNNFAECVDEWDYAYAERNKNYLWPLMETSTRLQIEPLSNLMCAYYAAWLMENKKV